MKNKAPFNYSEMVNAHFKGNKKTYFHARQLKYSLFQNVILKIESLNAELQNDVFIPVSIYLFLLKIDLVVCLLCII